MVKSWIKRDKIYFLTKIIWYGVMTCRMQNKTSLGIVTKWFGYCRKLSGNQQNMFWVSANKYSVYQQNMHMFWASTRNGMGIVRKG